MDLARERKNNMDNYRAFAEELVRKAGARLTEMHRDALTVSYKGDDTRNVITNLDTEISEFLRAEIQKTFPDHRVYSEEDAVASQAQMQGYEWVLDPIDGTANFSRGVPHFAVCVGLLKDGAPIVGAICNPITDELFSFEAGTGAFLNGTSIHAAVSSELSEAHGLIIIGHKASMRDWGLAVYRSFLEQLKKVKGFGSSSLDLCFLAAGRVDVVVYGTLSTRDIASAVGVVRAAGGEVYAVRTGEPVAISTQAQPIIATANKVLFENLKPYLHTELLPS